MALLTKAEEVRSALAELGLTEETIAEVVRRGEMARNSTTAHHPRNAGGWYAYSEATAAFRDLVVPIGGEAISEDGYERCICPGGQDEIAILSGDRCTGNPDPECIPQPKYTKPRVTAQEVIARSQIELFKRDIATPRNHRRLWFLLVRREGDIAKVELSRPGGITDSGRVNVWDRRIIVQPVSVSPVGGDRDKEETEPVVIDITPKS